MSMTMMPRLTGILAAVALAAGLGLGVAPAEAAPRTVWEKVASCESGGRWSINTHNGYYGGLQFASRTWAGHGGKTYARSANRASKAEQIAIARRVLATQGPGAWGGCARKAKLTKKNGQADRHATPATNPGAGKPTKARVVKKPAKKQYSSPSPAPTSHVSKTVRVQRGDTIRKIAKRNHVAGGWRGLWRLNKRALKDPNTIYVGQVLKIT